MLRPPASKTGGDSVNVRLVVLPFANMSNDPTQEYFSDGLTEEMITQIGRLCPGRLGVIARTSSMLFKRSAKSASEIGRELSADYLLEGSPAWASASALPRSSSKPIRAPGRRPTIDPWERH
jgi:TolB-like protein